MVSTSLFEFTLTNIDPSIFNTFSDLLGQCISGILVFTLAMVYPYLVFDSLNNRGGGANGAISLDTLISPPGSLMEIIIGSHNMFGNGTSKSLLLKISFILLIATFSHPISDIFLKFENKQVSEREAWLLSSSTASTPFYSLLGDKINYSGTRALPVQRLLSRTDYIANGLSRFSITTKESSADFNTISITSQGGYDIDMTVFNLTTSSKTKTTKTRSIPLLPIDVECTPWNNEQQQEEEVVNGGTTTTTLEYYESKNNNNNSTTHSLLRLTTNDTFVPNCNYEIPIIIPTLDNSKEEEKEGKNNAADNNDNDHGYYWNVQSRMILQGRSLSDGGAYKNFVFGFDNNINDDSGEEEEEEEKDSTNGNYSVVLDLTPDETRHGLDRSNNNNNDNWKLGRQIRNQLKYYIGGEDGHTIQVEFSILTSSPVLDFSDGRALYIISSWSYECPSSSNNIMVDDGGSTTTTISSLSIENYKEKKKKKNQRPTSDDDSGEGCIINMQVLCDRFPEDSDPRIHRIIGRKCQQGELMEVITLQNINIDETILAVYSGTVLRNNGFYENLYNGHVNINSISASYLVTRQVVYGNIPITDVRPVIGIPYVFFMILPLLVALPLLCIVWRRKKHRNTTELPIPKDMWQAMVFAHRDETTIYKFLGSCRTNQDPYPPQPLRLMFGMLSKGSSGNDNSGTTSSSLSPPKARSQPVYGLGTNLTSSNYSAEVTTTTINYTPDGRVLVNKTPYKVTDPNAIIKKDTIKFPNKKTAVEYGY